MHNVSNVGEEIGLQKYSPQRLVVAVGILANLTKAVIRISLITHSERSGSAELAWGTASILSPDLSVTLSFLGFECTISESVSTCVALLADTYI